METFELLGIILGILIGIILLYLIIVIFFPGFKVEKQALAVSESKAKDMTDKLFGLRKDLSFDAGGMQIRAWLYLPQDLTASVPCIIMNHGCGGTKDMVLQSYALRFQKAGFASLVYDYRHFGESEGKPRQLFSFSSQLEDCKAAIAFVRSLKQINPDKIAIWGTSAGGGYGLAIAAQNKSDEKIACVCAQCASLDTHMDVAMAFKREGPKFFLRLFMHAQRDKGRSRFGLSAHKIPIVGKPGSLAMITAPQALKAYTELAQPGFINEVCARYFLTSTEFSPIDHAKDVQCPVLIQICEKDNLVSMSSALKTAKILGKYAEVKRYPIGHFDIYSGEHFERSVEDQVEFFKKHLSGVREI
jgi:uncharacterized protein